MEEIIFYIVTLVLLFLLYYVFIIRNKRRLKKFSNNTYVNYLIGVYKLDRNKINMKELAMAVIMVNSFIIATTVFIVGFINNMILMLVLGIVVLIPLQLLMYHIIGTTFKKKFGRDK